MKRCAVIIGVGKSDGMQPLKSAVDDADKFEVWARGQGFETTLITDKEDKVTVGEVFKAISAYTSSRSFDQMIIFFSGHGMLQAPGREVWFLSDALKNSNEAIDLAESIDMSRYIGIPHIVFISDACRNLPRGLSASRISGSVIFPNEYIEGKNGDVDVFYASRPGSPAFAAASTYSPEIQGILTRHILEGLNGHVRTIAKQLADYDDSKWFVTAFSLKGHIELAVPLAISKIDIELDQMPEVRVESHDPKYLSELKGSYGQHVERSIGTDIDPGVRFGFFSRRAYFEDPQFESLSSYYRRQGRGVGENPDKVIQTAFSEILQKSFVTTDKLIMQELAGRLSKKMIETLQGESDVIYDRSIKPVDYDDTGLIIYGMAVKSVLVNSGTCELIRNDDHTLVKMPQNCEVSAALVILHNDTSVPVAILDKYWGVLVLMKGVLLAVNYIPGGGHRHYYDYVEKNIEIERRRSLAAALAVNGFRSDLIIGDAKCVRQLKPFDPSLALLACYAYASAGKRDDISSLYVYMSVELGIRFFDVGLLTGFLQEEIFPMAPFCPMVTQGWAYMRPHMDFLDKDIQLAAQYLKPDLWTTFDQKGTEHMVSYFNKIKI